MRVSWRRSCALYAALLVMPFCGLAQTRSGSENSATSPPLVKGSDNTYRLKVGTQLVLLDASVLEKKSGARQGDLHLGDFTLTEDGKPQQLTYISEDKLPLSIVFMFDVTDTVAPVVAQLAEGAKEVLAHLRPEDEAAVMTFSSHATLLQDFTTDHAALEAAFSRAGTTHDVNTATFIYEDVWEATEQSRHSRLGSARRVQVWLTDSTANHEAFQHGRMGRGAPEYLHTKEEAVAQLEKTDIVVSELIERSLLTDAQIPFTPLIGRMGDVRHMADDTGGPVLHTSRKQVAERMANLLDALRQRYTLGYRPSDSKPPGTICSLTLRLSPAFYAAHPEVHSGNLVVRTRARYVR